MSFLVGLDLNDVQVQTDSGNASTTAFTLDVASTTNAVAAYISGVRQLAGTDYSVSGTTITFTTAPPTGTNNISYVYTKAAIINTPADASVTAAKLGTGAVETAKLAANAVDETKLKDALVADFTEVTVAAGDSILLGDVGDSGNTKRDTVQGILDLVPAGANRIFIEEITPSGVTTSALSAAAIFNGTYDIIEIEIIDYDQTAQETVQIQVSISSSYLTSGYLGHTAKSSSGSTSYAADVSTIGIGLGNPSTDATATGQWLIRTQKLNGTAFHKGFKVSGGYEKASGEQITVDGFGSYTGGTGAIDGIRLNSATANHTATVRAWGIKNA